MDDFVFTIVILSFCLEVFFIYKDVSNLYKFKKLHPSKNETLKYFGVGLLRIIAFLFSVTLVSFLLNLIPFSYYWFGRNEALIAALKPNIKPRLEFYRFISYFFFSVSVIFMAIIKFLKKRIAFSIVFPISVFGGFILFVMILFDYNYKYYKNPLADTKVSATFKPLNVPLLKEGLTKKEVLELLGYPILMDENSFLYSDEGWSRGWYDYLWLKVHFDNDVVVKIEKEWRFED